MIVLQPLTSHHWPAMYEIYLQTEPFGEHLFPTLSHFKAGAAKVEGFALLDGERLVGTATFSGLTPLADVYFGFNVLPQYWGKWATRAVLRTISRFPFIELDLPRVSAVTIKNMVPQADMALLKAGFRVEGVRENAVRCPDGLHDQVLYGMLRERCRWLLP